MGGKAARTKGHSFERFIAIQLRNIDKNARRNVQETQQASVDILTCLPLAIQCKALKRWSLTPHAVYHQAAKGSLHKDDVPVGVIKIDNRQPVLCFLALEHFIALMEALYGEEAKNSTGIVQLRSWVSSAEAASPTKTPKS